MSADGRPFAVGVASGSGCAPEVEAEHCDTLANVNQRGAARVAVRVAIVAVVAMASSVYSARGAVAEEPWTLTTLDGTAGYFEASGVCPEKTATISFEWSPAPNGDGHGDVAISSRHVNVRLRMQAPEASEAISVTLKCRAAGGKRLLTAGPFTTVSGNGLLQAPRGALHRRQIIYSLSAQQLWAIDDDGTVARTYLVSGRRLDFISGAAAVGQFAVFSKSLMGCVINGVYCPLMVRFNRTPLANVGFHAIPYSEGKRFWQSSDELGQPRSGGCVRADPDDAKWLYDWSTIGDSVYVIEGTAMPPLFGPSDDGRSPSLFGVLLPL